MAKTHYAKDAFSKVLAVLVVMMKFVIIVKRIVLRNVFTKTSVFILQARVHFDNNDTTRRRQLLLDLFMLLVPMIVFAEVHLQPTAKSVKTVAVMTMGKTCMLVMMMVFAVIIVASAVVMLLIFLLLGLLGFRCFTDNW
jgi:hypothetical protein